MTGTAKTSKQKSSNSNGSDRQHLQRCTDQSIVFARNHQCAPPLYAIYVIPWVYETLQPEWQLQQFSNICRAHDRDQHTDRQINPSYSPEIANVHPYYMQYVIPWVYVTLQPEWQLQQFSYLQGSRSWSTYRQTDRHTHTHGCQSISSKKAVLCMRCCVIIYPCQIRSTSHQLGIFFMELIHRLVWYHCISCKFCTKTAINCCTLISMR